MRTDTKTEVGRELDVRIAELLGWSDFYESRFNGLLIGKCPPDSRGNRLEKEVPHYSTDPAAAMGLLQEVLKRGWQAHVTYRKDRGFTVSLYPESFDYKDPLWLFSDDIKDAEHPSIEGAWALAGLAALEADRELGGEP